MIALEDRWISRFALDKERPDLARPEWIQAGLPRMMQDQL